MTLGVAEQEPLSCVYACHAIPVFHWWNVAFSKIERPLDLIAFDKHFSLKVYCP
jgi:hypothetical protein